MDVADKVVAEQLEAMREKYQQSRQCDNEEMIMQFKNFQSVFDNKDVCASIQKQASQLICACKMLAPAQTRKCESIVKQLWERNVQFRISPDKDP